MVSQCFGSSPVEDVFKKRIADLEAEILSKSKEIGHLQALLFSPAHELEATILNLEAENERLRDALGHYADEDNWDWIYLDGFPTEREVFDGGPQIAQAALEERDLSS